MLTPPHTPRPTPYPALDSARELLPPSLLPAFDTDMERLLERMRRYRDERDLARSTLKQEEQDRALCLALLDSLLSPGWLAEGAAPDRLSQSARKRLMHLLDLLVKTLCVDYAAIVLMPMVGTTPDVILHSPHPEAHELELKYHCSSGMLQRVWEEGKPMNSLQALADPRLKRHASVQNLHEATVLCLPLEPVPSGARGILWLQRQPNGVSSQRRVPSHHEDGIQSDLRSEPVPSLATLHFTASEQNLAQRFAQTVARQVLMLRQRYQTDGRSDPTEPFRKDGAFKDIVARSQAMARVFQQISAFVTTDRSRPILLIGPSGSGKEGVARAIHQHPAHETLANRYEVLNCTNLSPNDIESALFGHVKGAFTGAVSSREGLFLKANGGTVFLDEIGDLPLELQAKLLRTIEEQTIRPMGTDLTLKIDVRIILATHRPLAQWVKEGRFRSDLWYRINALQVSLPSLAQRLEDIEPLAQHFIQKHTRVPFRSLQSGTATASDATPPLPLLSTADLIYLQQRPWPGEVRELEGIIVKAIALRSGSVLQIQAVATQLSAGNEASAALPQPPDSTLKDATDQFQRNIILHTLQEVGYELEVAARRLGVSVPTLYRYLKDLNIPTPRKRQDESTRGASRLPHGLLDTPAPQRRRPSQTSEQVAPDVEPSHKRPPVRS